MDLQEQVDRLRAEVSRLRTLVLILSREKLAELSLEGSAVRSEDGLPDVTDYLEEVSDLVREDEEDYLAEVDPPQKAEEPVALPPITRTVDMGVPQDDPVTLENVEEMLLSVLQRYAGAPMSPQSMLEIQTSVYGVVNALTHTLDLRPDFWQVEIEPNTNENTLSLSVIPRVLVPFLDVLDVVEEEDGTYTARVLLGSETYSISDEGSHLFVRDDTSLGAVVALARLVDVRGLKPPSVEERRQELVDLFEAHEGKDPGSN